MEQNPCKIYYCYKATNDVNGKIYIGFAANPITRWRNHKHDAEKEKGFVFADAIRKHGWEHFHFEVICCGKDKQAMLEHVEPALIQQYHSSVNENGYNVRRNSVMAAVSPNVGKRIWTEEQKLRLRNRNCSTETREKLRVGSLGNKNCVGRVASLETRMKMRVAKLGTANAVGKRSLESRIKMSISHKGKKQCEETKIKRRVAYRVNSRTCSICGRFFGSGGCTCGQIEKGAAQQGTYNIVFPNGHKEIIKGLKNFCEQHKLHRDRIKSRNGTKGYHAVRLAV